MGNDQLVSAITHIVLYLVKASLEKNSLSFYDQRGGHQGLLSFLKVYYILEGLCIFLIYILKDIMGLSKQNIRAVLCQIS